MNVHDVTYLMVEIKPIWEQLLRLYNTYAVMSTLKTQTDEFRDVNKELKDLFRKGKKERLVKKFCNEQGMY